MRTSTEVSCLIILVTEPCELCVPLNKSKPGDHLLLFVRSITAAAQVDAGRRQEVKAMILKVLVKQRQQDL